MSLGIPYKTLYKQAYTERFRIILYVGALLIELMKSFLPKISLLTSLLLSNAVVLAKPDIAPRKFDSYGAIACDDAMAHLDAFAIELQNEPNASGYVVIYPERNGLPGRSQNYMDSATSYLEMTRGIPRNRLNAMWGEYRDGLTTELWTVPRGSSPPVASRPPALDNTRSLKFDEGFADYTIYKGEQSLWTYDLCALGAVYFTAFARQLQSEPNSIGRIIIHLEYGKRSSRARIMAYLLRTEMVKNQRTDSRRIVIVSGARRKSPMVELWIVPKHELNVARPNNSFGPERRERVSNLVRRRLNDFAPPGQLTFDGSDVRRLRLTEKLVQE
jgi:hypothetical protein